MDNELLELVSTRVRIHYLDFPGFSIADAYKLVYQGCMGPEHAISDLDAVKQWLDREWDSIEASSHDGLYSDTTIHSPVHRINLRAAKAFGISKEIILERFIGTADKFQKRPDLLRELWAEISIQIETGKELVRNPQDLEEFNKLVKENDYPAMHHSPEYAKKNKPAYRLVNNIID